MSTLDMCSYKYIRFQERAGSATVVISPQDLARRLSTGIVERTYKGDEISNVNVYNVCAQVHSISSVRRVGD